MAEIDEVNAKYSDFKLLKGLEVDILSDGSLDCSDDLLSELDYVIASVHSAFKMSEREMTQRVLKAVSNPPRQYAGPSHRAPAFGQGALRHRLRCGN